MPMGKICKKKTNKNLPFVSMRQLTINAAVVFSLHFFALVRQNAALSSAFKNISNSDRKWKEDFYLSFYIREKVLS